MSDALGDDFFEIFDVFLVKLFFFFSKLITLHERTAAKKTVAPQKATFCSLSEENNSTNKKIIIIKSSCLRRRWTPESLKLLEGHRIVFYHYFQRPRHLPHPHPGMLHTKVVIAHLTECLVVNLEEALPHPF